MAEMAPEPVPLAPAVAAGRPEQYAERFPDLYEAATSESARPSFKQVVQAWRLAKRADREDALAGDWLMPRLREKFGKLHGGVEKDYYCDRAVGGGLLATDRTLHSILNTDRPALAQAEIACKVMAREAAIGFAGPRLKPQLEEASDHAYSALTRVLGAADKVERGDVGDQDKDLAIASPPPRSRPCNSASQPPRRPPAQPRHPRHPHEQDALPPANPGLRPAPQSRRKDRQGNPPLHQALPRPPPLPHP
jgi:hypothetical protein